MPIFSNLHSSDSEFRKTCWRRLFPPSRLAAAAALVAVSCSTAAASVANGNRQASSRLGIRTGLVAQASSADGADSSSDGSTEVSQPAATQPEATQPPTTRPTPTTVWVLMQIVTHSYLRPSTRPISGGWVAPDGPYGAGHRGVDLATRPGDVVLVPEAGVVTFSGWVAGTFYLVVAHADGIRTTLGGLAGSRLRAGDSVRRGQFAGLAATTLHFGARVGDIYVDPTALLGKAPTRSWLVEPN